MPIENMVYIAHGPSDVPFSVLNQYGARTFAVYTQLRQRVSSRSPAYRSKAVPEGLGQRTTGQEVTLRGGSHTGSRRSQRTSPIVASGRSVKPSANRQSTSSKLHRRPRPRKTSSHEQSRSSGRSRATRSRRPKAPGSLAAEAGLPPRYWKTVLRWVDIPRRVGEIPTIVELPLTPVSPVDPSSYLHAVLVAKCEGYPCTADIANSSESVRGPVGYVDF